MEGVLPQKNLQVCIHNEDDKPDQTIMQQNYKFDKISQKGMKDSSFCQKLNSFLYVIEGIWRK